MLLGCFQGAFRVHVQALDPPLGPQEPGALCRVHVPQAEHPGPSRGAFGVGLERLGLVFRVFIVFGGL